MLNEAESVNNITNHCIMYMYNNTSNITTNKQTHDTIKALTQDRINQDLTSVNRHPELNT